MCQIFKEYDLHRATITTFQVFLLLYTGKLKSFKGIYYCPIEIIKGLTDKGQFQYLTKSGKLPVYISTISFTKIKINILSDNT